MGSSPGDPGPLASQSVCVEHRAGVERGTCTQARCFGGPRALKPYLQFVFRSAVSLREGCWRRGGLRGVLTAIRWVVAVRLTRRHQCGGGCNLATDDEQPLPPNPNPNPNPPVDAQHALKTKIPFLAHSLSDNNLTNHGRDMWGVIQIAEALKVNKTLQSIKYAA